MTLGLGQNAFAHSSVCRFSSSSRTSVSCVSPLALLQPPFCTIADNPRKTSSANRRQPVSLTLALQLHASAVVLSLSSSFVSSGWHRVVTFLVVYLVCRCAFSLPGDSDPEFG